MYYALDYVNIAILDKFFIKHDHWFDRLIKEKYFRPSPLSYSWCGQFIQLILIVSVNI